MGVHARLDDLERDLAADWLLLLGHVDDAHAPFADLLEQLVGADHRAGPLRDRRFIGRATLSDRWCRRLLHEVAGLVDGFQEAFDFRSQVGIGTAGLVQIGGSLSGRFDFQDLTEDASHARRGMSHGTATSGPMHVGPATRVASGGSRSARSLPFNATPPQVDCQKNARRRSTKSVGGQGVGLRQVPIEPGPSVSPVPIGGSWRNPQY